MLQPPAGAPLRLTVLLSTQGSCGTDQRSLGPLEGAVRASDATDAACLAADEVSTTGRAAAAPGRAAHTGGRDEEAPCTAVVGWAQRLRGLHGAAWVWIARVNQCCFVARICERLGQTIAGRRVRWPLPHACACWWCCMQSNLHQAGPLHAC